MSDNDSKEPRHDFSRLREHKRQGKTLTPPLLKLPRVTTQSWQDDRLPEMLWAALLVVSLPRHDSIMHLSAVAKAAMKFRDRPEVYPQHTSAARISATEFDEVFADVLAKPQVRKILSPLLLLDELPDRNHWKSHLPEPESENGWAALAAAVAQCMDRRARQAIDIRCLRVMFLALQRKPPLRTAFSEPAESPRLRLVW